jgi:hypothetical protein
MDSTNLQLRDPKRQKIRVIRLKYRSRLYGLHHAISRNKHRFKNKLPVSKFKSGTLVSAQPKDPQNPPIKKTLQINTNNNEIDEIFSKCKTKLNKSKVENQTPTTTKTKKQNNRIDEDKIWSDSRGMYRDSTGAIFQMLIRIYEADIVQISLFNDSNV